jgi:hypothetical protein
MFPIARSSRLIAPTIFSSSFSLKNRWMVPAPERVKRLYARGIAGFQT